MDGAYCRLRPGSCRVQTRCRQGVRARVMTIHGSIDVEVVGLGLGPGAS